MMLSTGGVGYELHTCASAPSYTQWKPRQWRYLHVLYYVSVYHAQNWIGRHCWSDSFQLQKIETNKKLQRPHEYYLWYLLQSWNKTSNYNNVLSHCAVKFRHSTLSLQATRSIVQTLGSLIAGYWTQLTNDPLNYILLQIKLDLRYGRQSIRV